MMTELLSRLPLDPIEVELSLLSPRTQDLIEALEATLYKEPTVCLDESGREFTAFDWLILDAK